MVTICWGQWPPCCDTALQTFQMARVYTCSEEVIVDLRSQSQCTASLGLKHLLVSILVQIYLELTEKKSFQSHLTELVDAPPSVTMSASSHIALEEGDLLDSSPSSITSFCKSLKRHHLGLTNCSVTTTVILLTFPGTLPVVSAVQATKRRKVLPKVPLCWGHLQRLFPAACSQKCVDLGRERGREGREGKKGGKKGR